MLICLYWHHHSMITITSTNLKEQHVTAIIFHSLFYHFSFLYSSSLFSSSASCFSSSFVTFQYFTLVFMKSLNNTKLIHDVDQIRKNTIMSHDPVSPMSSCYETVMWKGGTIVESLWVYINSTELHLQKVCSIASSGIQVE